MGYVPPSPPPPNNVDKYGMPKDYATYVWRLYRKRVKPAYEEGGPSKKVWFFMFLPFILLLTPVAGWVYDIWWSVFPR